MSINKNYGLYTDADKTPAPVSDLSLDFIVPLDFMTEWQRCGLVADFLARYQSFNFKNPEKALNVLSTVVNELLENGVKFSADKNKLVNLSLRYYGSTIEIETVNTCDQTQAVVLDTYIERLKNNDSETMFLEQIQKSEDGGSDVSGLGLITILKDYDAQLGIRISPKTEGDTNYDVFVKVVLSTAGIEKI